MKVWRGAGKEWKQAAEGVKRLVAATVDECMIAVYEIKQGSGVPMHSHPEKQMGVMIQGKGRFTTRSGEVTLERGDSYVIESNEEHAFEALEDCLVVDLFLPSRRDFKEEVREPDVTL